MALYRYRFRSNRKLILSSFDMHVIIFLFLSPPNKAQIEGHILSFRMRFLLILKSVRDNIV